jgi:hypothetical protein
VVEHGARRSGLIAAALAGLLVLGACGGSDGGDATDTTIGSGTLPSDTTTGTADATSAPESTGAATVETTEAPSGVTQPETTPVPPDTTAQSTTLKVVTTQFSGKVVLGSSGDVGKSSTEPGSEAVRLEAGDGGACEGWDQGNTESVVPGAPVQVFDASGTLLGSGTLGAGQAHNVATSGPDQWQCEMAFSFKLPASDTYVVRVGSQGPRRKAVKDGDTWFVDVAQSKLPTGCAPEGSGPVTTPSVTKQWVVSAARDLCTAGAVVTGRVDACSPAGVAADRVVAVRTPNGRVVEDLDGVHEDVVLSTGDPVVLVATTGVPCTR